MPIDCLLLLEGKQLRWYFDESWPFCFLHNFCIYGNGHNFSVSFRPFFYSFFVRSPCFIHLHSLLIPLFSSVPFLVLMAFPSSLIPSYSLSFHSFLISFIRIIHFHSIHPLPDSFILFSFVSFPLVVFTLFLLSFIFFFVIHL